MNTSSLSIALVSLFAALIAVFGLIPKIDLPLGVPITLQTLGVMLAGCMLGPKRALQALLLFLAAVAIGLPLLSGGRGGIGVKAAKIDENSRGVLVGAMIVEEKDSILAITSGGTVMRTACSEVRETSRDTLGVRLVNLDEGISVVSITQVKDVAEENESA